METKPQSVPQLTKSQLRMIAALKQIEATHDPSQFTYVPKGYYAVYRIRAATGASLAKLGLTESTWLPGRNGSRGRWAYRLTEKGRAVSA